MTQPLHVLVVDDDPADRLLLRRALEKAGFAVDVTPGMTSALGRITSDPAVDCAVVDLHLADGDVSDLATLPDRTFAIVVVSGLDPAALRTAKMRVYAEDFVSKDEVSARSFAHRIPQAIALHATNRELTRTRRELEATRHELEAARAELRRVKSTR